MDSKLYTHDLLSFTRSFLAVNHDNKKMSPIHSKGQVILKVNYQALNSSKKRTNEFVFTTMRRVFVRFLEEVEDTKKTFRN